MTFVTSAVTVFEHDRDEKMALRDLGFYRNLVRRCCSNRTVHPIEVTEEIIDQEVNESEGMHNECLLLDNLLSDDTKEQNEEDYFNLSDWARETALMSVPNIEVNGMTIWPKEGWFPAEKCRIRTQCNFKKSMGSLSVSANEARFTKVPKMLAGTVEFVKRVRRVGITGFGDLELTECDAHQSSKTAGVLDLATSGLLGDSCVLWGVGFYLFRKGENLRGEYVIAQVLR